MNLKEYFTSRNGTGILSTADGEGRVDTAIYSTPHIQEDGSIIFIMRERLIHENLQTNPYAAYLFLEDGPGHRGIRLFLKKTREDVDPDRIATMTRRHLSAEEDQARGPKHLVYFQLEKALALIGGREADI